MQWSWFRKWMDKQETTKSVVLTTESDKWELLRQVDSAKRAWRQAQMRLEWAVEKDHIDYAIYDLEAAEKRYEMLLRMAKKERWTNTPLKREHG